MTDAELEEANIPRVQVAIKAIVDGRDVNDEVVRAQTMVTLEHAITTMLVALFPHPRDAAVMLNEALVPSIEQRLAMYAAKKGL